FGVGDDGVGISAGDFGSRHRHIDVLAGIRRNFYADALLQGFFAQIGAPGPRGNGDMNRRALWRYAHFFGTVKHQGTDVAGLQLVLTYDIQLRGIDGVLVVGDAHLIDVG